MSSANTTVEFYGDSRPRKEPEPKTVGFFDLGPGPELSWLSLDDIFSSKVPDEIGSTHAYLQIPDSCLENETLSESYKKIQAFHMSGGISIKPKTQFADTLRTIIEAAGFRQVMGFSGIRDVYIAGEKYPLFGQMTIVPITGEWVELPAGTYDLSIAKRIKDGGIPEGTRVIKKLQDTSHVLQFDRQFTENHRRTNFGWSYIEATRFERFFNLFYDGTPGQRKDWVVLKTPEAIRDYLQIRFQAGIDLKIGLVTAPKDQIGAIIGKPDELSGKRHIERLQEVLKKPLHFRNP